MNRRVLIMGFPLLYAYSALAQPPADSVVSSRFRTSSGIEIESQKPGRSSFLDGVNLAAQRTPDTFVRYGPFVNRSSSMLTISLQLSWGRGTVVGWINGAEVASSPHYVQFNVPPSASYHLVAKGPATVSASADLPGLINSDVGLPVAEDFETPHGEFVMCSKYLEVSDDVSTAYSTDLYYYKEGSMSDRSYVFDQRYQRPGLTSGPRPPYPVHCGI